MNYTFTNFVYGIKRGWHVTYVTCTAVTTLLVNAHAVVTARVYIAFTFI